MSTGKEKVERIDERIQQGTVLETDRYKYQGIVVNTEGNLKDHMQEIWQRSNGKQFNQTVTASPNINTNCKSNDGDRDMAN